MRRFLLPILPFIALALMGASCEFKAGVNNPVPTRDADAPRDETGLLVVVRTGDPILESASSTGESVESLVAVALSMSTLTAQEDVEPTELELMRTELNGDRAEPLGAVRATTVLARPSAAIPEPSGLLLFGCGICLSAIVRRRH